MRKQKKEYVSELDQFLADFDKQHPELSQSQIAEIKKAGRVAWLRDHAERDENDPLWKEF